MKQVWIPRVVTRCHNNIEQFDDNSCDESGYKSQCMVRYETNCYNKKIYREVTEDYPECKTETVSTCDGNDLFSSRKSRRCQKKSQQVQNISKNNSKGDSRDKMSTRAAEILLQC